MCGDRPGIRRAVCSGRPRVLWLYSIKCRLVCLNFELNLFNTAERPATGNFVSGRWLPLPSRCQSKSAQYRHAMFSLADAASLVPNTRSVSSVSLSICCCPNRPLLAQSASCLAGHGVVQPTALLYASDASAAVRELSQQLSSLACSVVAKPPGCAQCVCAAARWLGPSLYEHLVCHVGVVARY